MSPILPAAPDAEQAFLASFLLAPREVAGLCAELQITAESFHAPAHGLLLVTLLALCDTHRPVDFVTLTQFLRDRDQLEAVGGAGFLTSLFIQVSSAANATYYATILKEKQTLRQMIKVCGDFAARSYQEQDDPAALLEECERQVLGIRHADHAELKEASNRGLMLQIINRIEDRYARRGGLSGLPTGFTLFDEMTDGLQPSDLILIAARPSMGKTAFGMNIAEHVALVENRHAAIFTLEMSDQQLLQRAMFSVARIDGHAVRRGFLSEADFPRLTAAGMKLAGSDKLHVIDANGATIQTIRARARRLKQRHAGLALIVLDYLQLARSNSPQARNNREREVAEISAGCKSMAKELGIPVVVLAQLNREADKRTGEARGRPRLSDLRESGAIEQDADLVGLLHREEYYATTEQDRADAEGKATLIIAKHRNGPTGDIPLTFLKECTRFENRAGVPPQ